MTETFQLTKQQAVAYEDQFVPALFGQWATQLVDCARVRRGQSVLDVACGTGVVARTASKVVGADGRVVGVDLNLAMLEVAGHVTPDLEWVHGDAEDLPFADAEFDVALCQSALFFFADPGRAVAEMARVVAPWRCGRTADLRFPGRSACIRPLCRAGRRTCRPRSTCSARLLLVTG